MTMMSTNTAIILEARVQVKGVAVAIPLPGVPVIRAALILASVVALLQRVVFVLVNLSAGVFVAHVLEGKLRDGVLVVHDTELIREVLVGPLSVSWITNSRLAKVDHRDVKVVNSQIRSSDLCQSGSHGVTCGLDAVSRVKCAKFLNLSVNIVINGIRSHFKTSMDFALAIRRLDKV